MLFDLPTPPKPIKPFMKWVGGKQRVMPHIIRNLPNDYLARRETRLHIEPFSGAGSVFLHLQPQRAIINDINAELIEAFETVREDCDKLIEVLASWSGYNNPKDFERIKSWDRDGTLSEVSKAERTARLLYLNHCGFNGLYRVNAQGHFNVSFGTSTSSNFVNVENLRKMHEYFSKADISFSNSDFRKVLESVPEDSFVYLDPPYDYDVVGGFDQYAAVRFNKVDQKHIGAEFARLDEKLGCDLLLSNHKTVLIDDIFSKYSKTTDIISVNRTVNSDATKRGGVAEVLVRSY